MARHIWFADLAILSQERRADRVRSAAMKAAGESDDVRSPRRHARHAHRVLVCFSPRVAKESLRQRVRRDRHQLFSGPRPAPGVNKVRIEEQLFRLLANGGNDMRVTMSGPGDGMTAVKIQIPLTIARV